MIWDAVGSRNARVPPRRGLLPSSDITALSGETFIEKIGGDKGLNKKISKLGFTFYNQCSANEAEAFDFLDTCEAFDTYATLQTSFFCHWKEELVKLFQNNMDNGDVSIISMKGTATCPIRIKVSRDRNSNGTPFLVTIDFTTYMVQDKGLFNFPVDDNACFAAHSSWAVWGFEVHQEDGSVSAVRFVNPTEEVAEELLVNQ
jgi:hypothetical protein